MIPVRRDGWRRCGIAVFGSPVLGPMLVIVVAFVATPMMASASAGSGLDGSGSGDVRTVFLSDCATCHAPDGRGTSHGPTLAGQGAAGVDFMLTTGRMPSSSSSTTMRRHTPAYSPEMIHALDEYVAQLVPGGPAIPTVAASQGDLTAGGSIYREQCAACHQAAGEGGVLLGQNSPSLISSTPVQVVEAIRNGPGTMPVFGNDAISDSELPSVAAYVGALQTVDDPGGIALWHLGALPEGAAALLAMTLLVVALRQIGSRT